MDSHNIYYNNRAYQLYYPINNTSSVVKSLLNNKIWEKKLQEIFRHYIKPNHNVIDIGSYIGTHTLLFSILGRKVYAFEPQPLIFNCLTQTISDNSNLHNIIPYNIALYNNDGTIEMGTNNDGDCSSLEFRKKKFNNNFFINTKKLDNYNLEKIDFIKLDAEGSEFKILEGAIETIKRDRPKIVIEVWPTKTRLDKLQSFCELLDYNITKINKENYLLLPSEEV